MSETLTRRPKGPYLIESSPNYAMYRLMRLVRLPVDIACAAVSGASAEHRRMMNAAPIERKQ